MRKKLKNPTVLGCIGGVAAGAVTAGVQALESPADFTAGLVQAVAENQTLACVTTTALSSTAAFFGANLATALVQAKGPKALLRERHIIRNRSEYRPLLGDAPEGKADTWPKALQGLVNTPQKMGFMAQIATALGVGIAGIWTSEAYQQAWASLLSNQTLIAAANQTMSNVTHTTGTWVASSVSVGLTSFEFTILAFFLWLLATKRQLSYVDAYPHAKLFGPCRQGKQHLLLDDEKLAGGLPTDAEGTDVERDPSAQDVSDHEQHYPGYQSGRSL